MAQRRMFSPEIIESEDFLSLPVSSQALYFHLAMNADDDGFIQPQKIMRMVGSSGDDLKILMAKRFLLSFQNGVVVIKHWLIHNLIRGDRYKVTRFIEEKKTLEIKDNKAYTEKVKFGCQIDNQCPPQVRLGKVSIDKDTSDKSQDKPIKKKYTQDGADILKAFESIDPKNKTYYANKTQREACDFLIEEYGKEQVLELIPKLPETNKRSVYQITTPWEMKEKITKVFNDVKRQSSNKKQNKYYA